MRPKPEITRLGVMNWMEIDTHAMSNNAAWKGASNFARTLDTSKADRIAVIAVTLLEQNTRLMEELARIVKESNVVTVLKEGRR